MSAQESLQYDSMYHIALLSTSWKKKKHFSSKLEELKKKHFSLKIKFELDVIAVMAIQLDFSYLQLFTVYLKVLQFTTSILPRVIIM